jgi:two-component system LytT family sensor kinase
MKRSAFPDVLMKITCNRAALHVLFWIFFYVVLLLSSSGDEAFAARAIFLGLYLSFAASASYVHFFLLGRYLNRRRYLGYAVGLIITLGALGSLFNWIETSITKSNGSLLGSIFSLAFFLGFTTAIRYARAGIRQRMQLQEITAKQLQTELALLKAQINPHFLFNTLNNLYAMALRQEDPATAQGIAKLSHLMRYVIYESDVERIELSREVEQIRSFIELQKLRFSEGDDIRIDFITNGDLKQCTIAPMLLLPFVENAFKHGIRLSRPSNVVLRLTANDGAIRFSVENTVHGAARPSADCDSALGLRNVRRRLELLYAGTHSLSIREEQGIYRVVLDLGTESLRKR